MAFNFNGNPPSAVNFNGSNVEALVYNGVTVWVHDITVVYSKACGGQRINTDPTVTLSTAKPIQSYGAGPYTYKLQIPYRKTISDVFDNQAYVTPTLKDASGNTVQTWSRQMLNGTKGTEVRFMTLTWTSDVWLGGAESYTLALDASGGNGSNVQYPSGQEFTLTATNK